MTLCGAVLFAVLAFYGIYLFLDDWQYGTTSPGIGVPQWIYTVWLPRVQRADHAAHRSGGWRALLVLRRAPA